MKLTGNETDLKSRLISKLKAQGFSRVRTLSPLPDFSADELPLGLHCDPAYPPEARTAVMVFFPYYRGDKTESEGSGPVLSLFHGAAAHLAPFARRNNYKEVVNRLKIVISQLCSERGLAKDQLRIFCNSRFPEKQMAWHSGLGFLGKNSLIITPEYGSLGVIGGFFLPFDLPGDNPLESAPYENCGVCRKCSNACPGGALKGEGGIVKSLCYQHLSTSHEILSEPVMETWGHILYGCQICQDTCPYNQNKPEGVPSELGVLGAGLNPLTLLSLSDQEIKKLLNGSVPGASWIKPAVLKRNALLCLPREESFRKLVDKYAQSEDPVLAGTAEYVIHTIPEKV